MSVKTPELLLPKLSGNSVQNFGWTGRAAAVSLMHALERNRQEIAERLIQIREARNLSQERLAQIAGVSAKTVSRIENAKGGAHPGTYDKLAEALDVTVIDITGEPPAPLGLGENSGPSQLDRIEAKLDAISERLAALGLTVQAISQATTTRSPAEKKPTARSRGPRRG